MGITRKIFFAVLIITIFTGIYVYPKMPERIETNWGNSMALGDMPRFLGVFLIPILFILVFLILMGIKQIGAVRREYEKSPEEHDKLIQLFLFFFMYLHILNIVWNLGYRPDMAMLAVSGFGIMIYCLGAITAKVKQNHIFGVRTYWTLNNKIVWEKTHRLAGILFRAAGLLIVVQAVSKAGEWFIVLLFAVLIAIIYPVIYSYVEYKKLAKTRV